MTEMLKFSDKEFGENFIEVPQQANMDTWEKDVNFSKEKAAGENECQIIFWN